MQICDHLVNNPISQRKPSSVIAPSREISRHHQAIIITSNTKPIKINMWNLNEIKILFLELKRDHLMSQIKAKVTHLPYDKDDTLYLTFIECA